MNKPPVRLFALILAAAFADPAAAQQLKPWRHAIIEAKSDSGIFFMPFKGGFAQKQGLDVELMQVKQDGVGLKALIAGEVDSFEGGAQGAMAAAARGADVKILGCSWVVVPHGIFVRNAIKSLKDLKGKAIAVSAPGTFPELVAKAAFDQQHIAYDDVKFAALGSDGDRYKALVAGVVEGAVVSNEYLPIAAKQGVKLLVPGSEAVPNFVRVCLFTTSKVIKERHDDMVKFLAAEMQGLRSALDHPDATIKLAHEMTGSKPDDPRPAFVIDNVIKTHAVAPDLPAPLDKLEAMQKVMIAAGSIPKAVDVKTMVDGSIRAEALKLAGPTQ